MSWVTKKGSFEFYGEKVNYFGKESEMHYKFETPWAAELATHIVGMNIQREYGAPSESISHWGMF